MCSVSMVMTDFLEHRLPAKWPTLVPPSPWAIPAPAVSREEFERLRAEVEELKLLLKAAKRYDEKTGQPDCENEQKLTLIRRVADLVGVKLDI